jgi:hypothetical protein
MRRPFGGNRRNEQSHPTDALRAEYRPVPPTDAGDTDAEMAEAIVAARRIEFAALSDLNDSADWSDVG